MRKLSVVLGFFTAAAGLGLAVAGFGLATTKETTIERSRISQTNAIDDIDIANPPPPYLSPKLTFKPHRGGLIESADAISVGGAGDLHIWIGSEPLFVDDACSYVEGMTRAQRLNWIFDNFTFDTPVSRRFSVNGTSSGMCGNFAELYSALSSCPQKHGTQSNDVFMVGLHGLHSVAAETNGTPESKYIVDPMLNMELGEYQEQTPGMMLGNGLNRSFTPDGFQIPTGTSRDYYMMALGETEALRRSHGNGQAMSDHSAESAELRLNWVDQRETLFYLSKPEFALTVSRLYDGQELVIANRPIIHAGITALQRQQQYLFRSPGGEYALNKMNVMPSSFANGFLVEELTAGSARMTIGLPIDAYAVEIEMSPQNGIPNTSILNELGLVVDGKPVEFDIREGIVVYEVNPASRLSSVVVVNLPAGVTIKAKVFFLVPERLARALRSENLELIAPSRFDIGIAVEDKPLTRDLRYWSPSEDVAYGTTSDTVNLLRDETAWRVEVVSDGWKRYALDDTTHHHYAADYLDHPNPIWMVTRENAASPLTFAITQVKDEATNADSQHELIKLASLAVVSSFENSLEVRWSDDGETFEPLYDHRPNSASSYGEKVVEITGGTFYVQFEGFRRDRLFQNERNFVSLSHLLLTLLEEN